MKLFAEIPKSCGCVSIYIYHHWIPNTLLDLSRVKKYAWNSAAFSKYQVTIKWGCNSIPPMKSQKIG